MSAIDHLPYHEREFDRDGFVSYLEAQGAVVLKPTNEWEVLRYQLANQSKHIVYQKKTGRLTFTGWSNKHYRDFQRGWALGAPAPSSPRTEGKTRQPKGFQRTILVRKLLKRDGPNCWFCGLVLGDDCTLEHLIPKSAKGGNSEHNLVLAHESCNGMAANKPLAEKIMLKAELTAQAADGRYEP